MFLLSFVSLLHYLAIQSSRLQECSNRISCQLSAKVYFLADRCNATFGYCHEMSSVVCRLPSVTRVYCGQTVSWIRMPLGTEVGLGPSDIVLDGDSGPPTQRGTAALPNVFGPCLFWPNGCMDQDASWYADRSLLGEAIFSACHTNPNPTH